jgi:phosphopantothenoylcysteine synthetase/decarboxylase
VCNLSSALALSPPTQPLAAITLAATANTLAATAVAVAATAVTVAASAVAVANAPNAFASATVVACFHHSLMLSSVSREHSAVLTETAVFTEDAAAGRAQEAPRLDTELLVEENKGRLKALSQTLEVPRTVGAACAPPATLLNLRMQAQRPPRISKIS